MTHHTTTVLELYFSFEGKTVLSGPTANYPHPFTSLGRVKNAPLIVGGFNTKVETVQNGVWQTLSDFPFSDTEIHLYSTVSYNDAVYLFG